MISRIYARALSGGEVAALSTFIPRGPTGLTTVAGNAKATLVWGASGGATSYYVKRSITSGNAYVTVTNVATPHYMDSGLVNGTTYYYVVSATNAAGESANSSEASVTQTRSGDGSLLERRDQRHLGHCDGELVELRRLRDVCGRQRGHLRRLGR